MRFTDVERSRARDSFDEDGIRRDFIRKVYSLLSVQLLITTGILLAFVFSPEVKEFALRHLELFFIAIAGMVVTMLIMMCCSQFLRQYPCNLCMLGFFTMCSSILIGYASCRYRPDLVLLAMGITTLVVICLTLFAMQTSIDFTVCGGVLCVALVLLIVCSIIGMFFPNRTFQLILAYGGAVIFSMYLVYDTQMMMGGEHKLAFDPEEYVFAVFALYLDIINLFLYILEILGLTDES